MNRNRSIVQNVAQLRSLPVGTTMRLAQCVPVVKVEPEIYATPADPGVDAAWQYYSEEELTGEAQGDPAASWFTGNRLVISDVPSA